MALLIGQGTISRAAVTLCACLGMTPSVFGSDPDSQPRLTNVQRVWGADTHAAFTDMTRFNGAFYLAFREAGGHVVPPPDKPGGTLRILHSEDGDNWKSVAVIAGQAGEDLRDARLTVTSDNRLMLNGAGAPQAAPTERQTYVWFSNNGTDWGDAAPIGEPNWWLWRSEWVGDEVYGIGYGDTTSGPFSTRVYRSDDGVNYDVHVETLAGGNSNEAALVFRDDGTAVTLIRRDGGAEATALLGTSNGDFTHWTITDTGVRVGGPDMIELPDGRLVAGGRFYDGQVRTALAWVDPEKGTVTEFLSLPSGGDTSYPGLVWHDEQLWVSYYSSHEGHSNIYVAQVEIPMIPEPSSSAGAVGAAMWLASLRFR